MCREENEMMNKTVSVKQEHDTDNPFIDNDKEQKDDVQDEIDRRLKAEMESMFASYQEGGSPPLIKQEPSYKEPSPPPADPSKVDADMDARLQAELNSLPMIKREIEIPSSAPPPSIHYLKPIIGPPQVAPTKQIVNPPSVFTMTPQVATNQFRTLAQVPNVTLLKGVRGENIAVQITRAPDGLITNAEVVPPSMGLKPRENFTASQLHQILQSAQPYLALPVTLKPGDIKNEPLNTRDIPGVYPTPGEQQVVEDEEVDYEEIGVADTFAAYWPSKLKVGRAHPDSVVETATLSSVELPDITYKLDLPPETTDCLSALQLEAVVYACQAHEQILPSGERAGFLLGDGAGVGKGRTIAGIIYDNYVKGRQRALWISVSSDLKFDAERDLADIGAHDEVRVAAISKFKYSRICSNENDNFTKGVIFCTYTALIGESVTANSKYKTRLRQLIHWLGKNFEGVIVFDECHKAKNLSLMNVGKSTKTGTTVLELQKLLPNARVVYASATGASEPRNMAYMVRLGLWGQGTAYPEFYEFVNAVEKRGIGAMEIVAMDMKLRGTYIARQLSFKDVSFRIEEVPMAKEFRKCYNLSAELWAEINKKFQKSCRLMCVENRVQKIITCQFWCAHQRFFKNLCIASKVNHVVKMTRQATRMGKAVVIGLQSTGESRTLEHLERHHGKLSTFVSTSKMIIQSFVEKHFPAPKRDSFHHLLNTGEFEPEARSRPPRPKKAKMNPDWFDDDEDAEAGDSDIEMYENTWNSEEEKGKAGRKRRGRPPKVDKVEKITMQERILQHLCNNMRAQDNDGEPTYTFDNTKPQKANITERDVERCISSREQLLDKIEVLGRRLPANTLDKLISELGGTNLVAEMTGRRGRVVRTEYDGYKYESRCDNEISMDLVNYREKQRFMDGSKHVAIISEAASSGISLQSDKRVSNQRRRLHITLELPWSADRAIQQFGRTHRSNQVNSPEYVFVITDLAGERRFASTVAKRLESLGALTQGDRRATDARDLSQFNIDNSIGRSALEEVMHQLTSDRPLDPAQIPQSYEGDFLYDSKVSMAGVGMLNVREENKVKVFSVEKDSNNISKFLNRILGCRVEVQNALFKFFLDKMYSLIMQMKRSGRFDLGILDLDAHGASVKSIKLIRFIRKHATGTAATELHTVIVERGMPFETALAKYRKEGQYDHDGFYVLQQLRHNKNSSILCLQSPSNAADGSTGKINLQIYRPNTGPQVRLETLSSISSRYVKVTPEEAREFWLLQYDSCLNMCSHVYWNRICPFSVGCEVGLRVRKYHVLSGLMLPIWDRIELIIEKNGHKIQIIRVKTDVNKKIVGTVVPHAVYDALVADLSSDSMVESQ
nr:protein strawberry notch [Drosophila takahashii]